MSMTSEELKNSIEKEYNTCTKDIVKIEKEIAKLQGKVEELNDRRIMLRDLLDKAKEMGV